MFINKLPFILLHCFLFLIVKYSCMKHSHMLRDHQVHLLRLMFKQIQQLHTLWKDK